MDLSKYGAGSKVRVDLTNGFYYRGLVISSRRDSITIIDKKGKLVTLSEDSILFLREDEK